MLKQFELLILKGALLYCGLQFLMRLYLASTLIDDAGTQILELIYGFILGFVRDLVSAALFLALLYLAPLFRGSARLFIMSYSHLLIILVLVFAVCELFFWMEFDGRPDHLVFHYLRYPVEVLAFLEDQFYLSLLLLPLALAVWFIGRMFRPWIFGKGYFPHSDMRKINQLSSN